MRLKEIVITLGLIGVGVGILSLSLGLIPALNILTLILGGWLLFAGINVLVSRVSMEAEESLDKIKAERRGQNMAHTAFAARDQKEFIEDERTNGKIVGGN